MRVKTRQVLKRTSRLPQRGPETAQAAHRVGSRLSGSVQQLHQRTALLNLYVSVGRRSGGTLGGDGVYTR